MNGSVDTRRIVSKEALSPPYAYDWLFSEYIELLASIDGLVSKLSDIGTCENACATSDAYKLKEYIEDSPMGALADGFLKINNTGTIGRYVSKWGHREMVYLGNRSCGQ